MKTIPFLFFSLILFMTTKSWANSKVVGNGGDFYSVQFANAAYALVDLLSDEANAIVNISRLRAAIQTTRVESTTKKLERKGIPKDALNFPDEKRILFNRTAWIYNANYWARLQMVLHEYLGIMNIEDSDYSVSSQILRSKISRTSGSVYETWVSQQLNGVQSKFVYELGARLKMEKDDGLGATIVEFKAIRCDLSGGADGWVSQTCFTERGDGETVGFSPREAALLFNTFIIHGVQLDQTIPGLATVQVNAMTCIRKNGEHSCQF